LQECLPSKQEAHCLNPRIAERRRRRRSRSTDSLSNQKKKVEEEEEEEEEKKKKKKEVEEPSMLAHTCNPSHLGSRDQDYRDSRPT
jgi:hypothetical protein